MSTLYDRVAMTVSGTPGTGTITLGAAVTDAVNGDRLSFANGGVPDGAVVSYVAIDGHNWGKGHGTYTAAGTTLSRDPAEVTWNGATVGNTPISLSSSAIIMIDALAADLPKGSLILLESHTASNSTALNFTTRNAQGQSGASFQSDFDHYVFELVNIVPVTTTVSIGFQCSTNGGSTYDTGNNYGSVGQYLYTGGVGVSSGSSDATSGIYMGGNALSNNSAYGLCGWMHIYNPLSTSLNKIFVGQSTFFHSTLSKILGENNAGYYSSLVAVNAARIISTSGNLSSGVGRLYGVAK